MTIHIDDPRTVVADITFRSRALKTNAGIYSRRYGTHLLPALAENKALRARYIGQVAWLGSERDWQVEDARRISELARDIARFGRFQPPAVAEACTWHADRLREMVRQHAALARLEAEHGPAAVWPASASSMARRRGGSGRTKARGHLG